MKGNKIIIIVFGSAVILFLLLFFSGGCSNRETDWNHNLYNTRTEPYGTYITYELLQDMFPDQKVESTRLPFADNVSEQVDEAMGLEYYEDEDDSYSDDSDDYRFDEPEDEQSNYIDSDTIESPPPTVAADDEIVVTGDDYLNHKYRYSTTPDTITTYIVISKDIHSFEQALSSIDYANLMQDYVGIGNNVFLSAESIDTEIQEGLGIRYSSESADSIVGIRLEDYPDKMYKIRTGSYSAHLIVNDSVKDRVRVLARDDRGRPVFVQLRYGKGYFFLNTVPMAYTNIEVLSKDNSDFAFRTLSYIPATNNILWDEFLKQGYEYPRKGNGDDGGLFSVIFAHRSLTMAFWLTLFGFLLFMIFRAKRMQRIIPIVVLPENSSVEFLDTISNLYYKKKDYRAIVLKRHAYFLDYIRKNYFMPTEEVDDDFIALLSAKTTIEDTRLNRIFNYHTQIMESEGITESVFKQYNGLLEEIYEIILKK